MVGGSIHDRLVRAARAEAQALPVNLRGRLPPPTAPVQARKRVRSKHPEFHTGRNPTGAEPHVSLAVEETENMPPPVPNPRSSSSSASSFGPTSANNKSNSYFVVHGFVVVLL
ncbi:hypothetical protein PEX1_098270 [Penicillium expansum]|uniref:Uncharacterized protein n=1 Tax=Penicillium expansum TaxID=27334 RepID=A0A0A2KEM5_PENEN|nr:hypothetical protein PEX2_003680 [Penicillium expansum]KGO42893.1 hypothetical protein PEXP_026420 [Penicillium expansum]KGO57014.1 hypothetical protein PEX2_003680 [Penicillium expansum]KGO62800.1 hypothetical protein PEX1_098270 [Penicillium expansum]